MFLNLHLPIHLSESGWSVCMSPLYLVLTILAVIFFPLIDVFVLVHLLLATIFLVHFVQFILLLVFIVILLLLHQLLLLLLLNHELLFLFICILHLLLLWVLVALHILMIVHILLLIQLDLLGLSLFAYASCLMSWSTEGSDLLFLLCGLAKHQELVFRYPSLQLLNFELFIALLVASPKFTDSFDIFIWITIVIGSMMHRSHLS